MTPSVMHKFDDVSGADVGTLAMQQALSAHSNHSDMWIADDATMDDCMTFACCVTTRESSMCFQSYQTLTTLNYDMRVPAFFIGQKPDSKDRPPKQL